MSIGRQGEKLFEQLMENRGYTVIDVSNDSEYQDKDIDFIITSHATGQTKTFEVKFDTKIHKTNNLYLETFNIRSSQWNYGGWWKFCEADYVAYGDAANNIFYVFPLLELRKRVAQLELRQASCGSDSEGLLLPLETVSDLYQVVKG